MTLLSKRILLVDNDPDVLRSLSLSLKLAGYEVVQANSVDCALDCLKKEIIHAAIVDLRLDSDQAPEDKSGFQVAEAIPGFIPFVMYTAYEDMENIRASLGRLHAKDILDKTCLDAAIQVVNKMDQLFQTEVKVNLDLRVDETIKLERIAAHIEVTAEMPLIPSADDVRQVLATLFLKADRISIAPFLPAKRAQTKTQPGSVVVRVRPHLEGTWGAPVIVKFGAHDEITTEASNYETLHPLLGGKFFAVLDATAFSRGIGGLCYSLIGAQDWDKIRTLGDVLVREDPKHAVKLLDRFFSTTFKSLYDDAVRESIDLAKKYAPELHLTPGKLRKAMEQVHPQEQTEMLIHFKGVKDEFINPVEWILSGDDFRPMPVVTRVCLCHGDLHSRNVLVDPEGHFWLIDFGRVNKAKSHALRDFAELESDIKFSLLTETNLNTLLPFENALLMPTHGEQKLPVIALPNESLRRAYTLIGGLRKSAAKLVHTDGDLREYYQALLFHTLKNLRLETIKAEKKQHVLMAAALICARLDNWKRSSDEKPIKAPRLPSRAPKTSARKRLQVFMSYHSTDREAVSYLARRLKRPSIKIWFDKWNLIPGKPWQEDLEHAIEKCTVCVVFWGPQKLGTWQHEEMRNLLERRVREKNFRVIPVLLPGAPDPNRTKMPLFLKRVTWVDFRAGLDDADAFKKLLAGIRGMPPGAV